MQQRKQLVLGMVGVLLLCSTLACATFRSPDDPAPTRQPTRNLPTSTASPTSTPSVFPFG